VILLVDRAQAAYQSPDLVFRSVLKEWKSRLDRFCVLFSMYGGRNIAPDVNTPVSLPWPRSGALRTFALSLRSEMSSSIVLKDRSGIALLHRCLQVSDEKKETALEVAFTPYLASVEKCPRCHAWHPGAQRPLWHSEVFFCAAHLPPRRCRRCGAKRCRMLSL
jgi:hypothetical protein